MLVVSLVTLGVTRPLLAGALVWLVKRLEKRRGRKARTVTVESKTKNEKVGGKREAVRVYFYSFVFFLTFFRSSRFFLAGFFSCHDYRSVESFEAF